AARPSPWDGRSAPGGALRIEGSASETDERFVPQSAGLHRTALYVTGFAADGAVLLEPVRGVEFGVRGSYSQYGWSHASTFGTMPLPDRPSLFGIGPEFRLELPVDRHRIVSLGLAANALHYEIPYAEWTRESCTPSEACVATGGGPRSTYALTNRDSEGFFVMTGGLYPSVALGDRARYGALFAIVAVTQGFDNDGFTNVRSGNGKIGQYAVPMVGGGYGFVGDLVNVNVSVYEPLAGDATKIAYGPGGMVTLGFLPRLWLGRRAVHPISAD
ncbi:MAG TPA: hypothetical protein VHB21_25455, partial [Minicystis sp.]|nr:hypothetical protein [Minicystis sp.]